MTVREKILILFAGLFLLTACSGGGGGGGGGGSVGADQTQSPNAPAPSNYGTDVTINGQSFMDADLDNSCFLNLVSNSNYVLEEHCRFGVYSGIRRGGGTTGPYSSNFGILYRTGGIAEYPNRQDLRYDFHFNLIERQNEDGEMLFNACDQPQRQIRVHAIKYTSAPLDHKFDGRNQFEDYVLTEDDFDEVAVFVANSNYGGECLDRWVSGNVVRPVRSNSTPASLVSDFVSGNWTRNRDHFHLASSNPPYSSADPNLFPPATSYLDLNTFELKIKAPLKKLTPDVPGQFPDYDFGMELSFSYLDPTGALQEVRLNHAGYGDNIGWLDVESQIASGTETYLRRTDEKVTAIKLDGKDSYMCSWSDCPNGPVCGTRLDGNFDPKTYTLTLQIPDNSGTKNPFDFIINTSNSSSVEVTLGGTGVGLYARASDKDTAFQDDIFGYCDGVE